VCRHRQVQSARRGAVEANDRKRPEQLCRYITRPALPDERVQLNAAGQVELKLKTPRREGTTHLVMSPLKFMPRLAAFVSQVHVADSPVRAVHRTNGCLTAGNLGQ
jgi:hypothetical protein